MIKKFICIAGKNNMAVETIEYLLEHHKECKLGIICNKTETGKNGMQKSLRWFAQKWNVKEYTLEDVYGIENLLFISLEFDQLIKPEKFTKARLFNIHFSLLPKYKGMFTSAIPIINGEKITGVTLHRIDSGIDTGEIIDQKEFEIEDMDCRELYFAYTSHGTGLLLRNIENLISGTELSHPQNTDGSSYYSKKYIDYDNLQLDLNQTADGIGRQIRAYNFREYQLPQFNGINIIDFYITNIRSNKKPGTIVIGNQNSVIISTIDYNICLYFDRFDELLKACESGNLNLVKEICAVRKHINTCNSYGWTPIIVATYNSKTDIVKYLISVGANIFCKNHNGTNLLMYAKDGYKKTGNSEIFKLLKLLGLSEKKNDYYEKNLLYYLNKEGLSMLDIMN